MFGYDKAILERFPTIRSGVVHATAVTNGQAPQFLTDTYRQQQQASIDAMADTAIAEVESIAAWRRVFRECGLKPTQHRVAVEALLRRLAKQGEIPSFSTLVDLGNLVSIKYSVPVAVFDLAGIHGATSVRYATGTERFTPLGSSEFEHPAVGEVIFVDDEGVVSARRWCWRQGGSSATGRDTTEALFVVEGHHESAESDVVAATEELEELLRSHQPSARTSLHLLKPGYPQIKETE